ncbi:MAG: diguanylate cyclase [Mariprofundus sp.]|nr:diguanylate cyclase [Mariprofundus sp.]
MSEDSIATKQTILLIVDEQKFVHHGIKKMLRDATDIEIHACYDAKQAVAIAEHVGPTVILQDINMPDISGLDLLAHYRQHPAIADVPVIILSGTSTAEVKADAFQRGADDYIVKMPHPIELIARIRHHSRAYIAHLEREAALNALQKEKLKLAAANLELERLSSLDGLTGIANRRYFDSVFEREWRRAMRETEPLSLIMCDVDFFKLYNDSYGHQPGDECLKLVASSLSEAMQRPTDLVARYGGEEFVILLPGTHAHGAIKVAEQVRHAVLALQLPHEQSTVHACVTISLGAATVAPMVKHQPKELLLAADKALYAAKGAGRNQVICSGI